MTEQVPEINVEADLQIRSIIGPAHPSHPDHMEYYTPDGIRKGTEDYPNPELFKLAWQGFGDGGKLTTIRKDNE